MLVNFAEANLGASSEGEQGGGRRVVLYCSRYDPEGSGVALVAGKRDRDRRSSRPRCRSRVDCIATCFGRRSATLAIRRGGITAFSFTRIAAVRDAAPRVWGRSALPIQCAHSPARKLREEPRIREVANRERIERFIDALSKSATEDTRVYLTGGATAVFYGWRDTTIDVDLKLEPERDETLAQLPALKERLSINVELAAPVDFIPVKEDWQTRSPFVMQRGRVSVYHFDLYAQALSKIERGHKRDLDDVAAMIDRGLVTRKGLAEYFDAIAPLLYRYPAIDEDTFRRAVMQIVSSRTRSPEHLR